MTLTLSCDNHFFRVDITKLSELSDKKELVKTNHDVVENLDGVISNFDSINYFISFINNKEDIINNTNINDLEVLGEKYKISSLLQIINTYKEKRSIAESKLNELIGAINNGENETAIMHACIQNIRYIYDHKNMMSLPIEIIESILKELFSNADKLDMKDYQVALFTSSVLNEFRFQLTPLFYRFSYDKIGHQTLFTLLSSSYFDIYCMKHPIYNKLHSLRSLYNKNCDELKKISADGALDKAASEFRNLVNNLDVLYKKNLSINRRLSTYLELEKKLRKEIRELGKDPNEAFNQFDV